MAEQDVLAKALPQPVAPLGKGRVGFKEAMGIDQPFLARKSELQPEISKADADIAKAQQEQKEIESTGKLSAQMRFGQQQEAAMTGMREKMEKEPLPAFIPTKDNAQDIAGLFGVISVISMLVGGGGRMSGQLALGNMNGMMEGYRKGREDLYKRERTEFDKNFKAMMQKHAEFRQEMEDAVKLAVTNKEEGLRAAELAAAKAGSDIVKAQLRKGDLVGAYKLVDESQKGAQHALQMEAKAKEQDARERQHREAMAQRERIAKDQMALREKLAKAAAAAKDEAAKKGGTLKPGAKITEGYVADTVLKQDLEDLKKDLQNPQLVEKLKQYKVEAFLTEEGKILNQLITSDIPNDLQKFLVKVRDIRNNYYLTISGKAVTGGEALRNYGTVPQPGDDAQTMVNKLDGMAGRVNQTIQLKRQLFGLPELNLVPGMKTNLKPNDDYSINSQTTYEINKVYTDDKGNKAKYLGNDEWEEIE